MGSIFILLYRLTACSLVFPHDPAYRIEIQTDLIGNLPLDVPVSLPLIQPSCSAGWRHGRRLPGIPSAKAEARGENVIPEKSVKSDILQQKMLKTLGILSTH